MNRLPLTPCAFAVSQACQAAIGSVLGMSDVDPFDVEALVQLFASVGAPRDYADALTASGIVHRFIDRAAHELHRRIHGGAVPAVCSFGATGDIPVPVVDQTRPHRWNAPDVVSAWYAGYVERLKSHHPPSIAERAITRLRTLNGQTLRVPDLARDLACSVPVLQRQFTESTGNSPRQFLIQLRVSRAIDLLRRTDWKVEAIAHEVGWRSKKDLHVAFARRVGATPGAIRRLNDDAAAALQRRLGTAG